MANVKELRAAMLEWLTREEWHYFITLNLNRNSTYRGLDAKFGEVCGRIDRRLLGPKFVRYPDRRLFAVGVPEHVHSNAHLHCLARFPTKPPATVISVIVADAWNGLIRGGSTDVRLIYDVDGLAQYITKDFRRPADLEHLYFSSSFWPDQSNLAPGSALRDERFKLT